MDYIVSVVLGFIQGITEFLPISSTGHLIIGDALFAQTSELAQEPMKIDLIIALHVGTAVAILLYFIKDWVRFAGAFFQSIRTQKIETLDQRLVIYIVIGSIPAAIIGLFLEKYITFAQNSILLVAVMLFLFSIIIFLADYLGKKSDTIEKVTWWKALIIGLAQCIALIPGVSRSGITISAALALNMQREAAARFSFLLSTPVVVGAAAWGLRDLQFTHSGLIAPFGLGVLVSFVVGWLSIHFLLAFLKRFSMNVFVIYRIAISIVLAIGWYLGWFQATTTLIS